MAKLLHSILLMSLLLVSAQSGAMTCQQFTADFGIESTEGIKLSPRLIEKIRSLETGLGNEARLTVFTGYELNDMRISIYNLEASMNRRELSLWGWLAKALGGDAQKLAELKTRKEQFKELNDFIQREDSKNRESEQSVIDSIKVYLTAVDNRFKKLKKTQNDLRKTICSGEDCLLKIEKALESLDLAHRTPLEENKDGVPVENMAFGFQNWQASPELTLYEIKHHRLSKPRLNERLAKEETRYAYDSVELFDASLTRLKTSIKEARFFESKQSGLTLDYVFEFYLKFDFDLKMNTDFVKLFKTFELSTAKPLLESLHTEVFNLTEDLKKEYDDLRADLDRQICVAREMCK